MTTELELPPNGELGEAHISEVEVTSLDAMRSMMDTARSGFPFSVDPGRYKRLHINHVLQMSNTQMEQRTNAEFIREARGQVLMAGLGIGYCLTKILPKPEVEHVTVVEKSRDLVTLLNPYFTHDKLTLTVGNIWEWLPSPYLRFDVIYFDIWADVSTSNLPEMTKLHRKFRRYLRLGGYMNSWSREGLRRMKRRGY